jgi:rubrerythrin
MSLFNVSEVFEFAIQIEENGEKFYRKVAEKMDNPDLKKTFKFLADQEIKHKEIFKKMASELDKYEPPESYTGEYFAYLKSYVNNVIFVKDLEQISSTAKDIDAVIDFAIRRELDSILYYQDVKGFISKAFEDKIDKIIEEERKHFIQLSEMKKSIKK